MPDWIEPIVDRTLADIENRTAKAFFNISDWQRIYGDIEFVYSQVLSILKMAAEYTEITAPAITSFPTAADLNTLVGNINYLRAIVGLTNDPGIVDLFDEFTPGSGGDAPDYNDINAWESNLALIQNALLRIGDDQIYSGVGACGQARTWQARFHAFPYARPVANWKRVPRIGLVTAGTSLTRQNRFRRYAA